MAENISSHQEALNLAEKVVEIGKTKIAQRKEEGFLSNALLATERDLSTIATAITKDGEIRVGVSRDYLENTLKALEASEKQSQAIQDTFPGLVSMANSADNMASSIDAFVPGFAKFGAIAIGAVMAFAKIQEAITETRKELGVSAVEAAVVTAQTKALGFAAKAYGLDVDDIKTAQAAIRNDLGASVQESVKLSLNFARTAAATGQTADELTGTLSIMESISSASRDVLLNQIRTNAAIIGAAGVSPALVMKDLAEIGRAHV